MPTLKTQIDAFNEEKAKQIPEDILKTIDNSTLDLKARHLEDNSLKTGDIAPDFALPDHNGKTQPLSKYLQDFPLVLSFYRGGW